MVVRSVLYTCLLLAVGLPGLSAKGKLPSWLNASAEKKDAYSRFDEADALILHDSMHLTYGSRGEIDTRVRRAVHIKTRDERDYAVAVVPMTNQSQKLIKFNAWLLYPSGRIETFKKSDLYQVAANMKALYSESRNYILDRTDSVRKDVVFAYEYEVSERTIFLQSYWSFQAADPTVFSQISVEVPKGWTAIGQLINNAEIEFKQNERSSRWTARYMPGVKDEVSRLPAAMLFSSVGISVQPTSQAQLSGKLQDFSSWQDLARYGDEVQVKALVPNDSIRAKAKELTQGAENQWEILQAIGEYAQSINYVMVDMNVNSGGGYTPHDAEDVFEHHYGDCKDMTVLARSMLQTLGIDSYAVIASVGREAYVHEEWPSPLQFNHCIVAVPVDDEIQGAAVVDHPQHGRILIFDPTQRYTPIGQLPSSLQGTKILLASSESESLVTLPRSASEVNHAQRDISVNLSESGRLNGVIKEYLSGSLAEYMRMVYRTYSKEDYEKYLTGWISAGARGAQITSIISTDHFEENRFDLEIEFTALKYGRQMGNGLLVFSPVFLTRHEWVPPVDEDRTADYVFSAWTLSETTRFELPEGFSPDAIAKPYETDESFVSYSLSSEMEDGAVTVHREMKSRHEVIPAARYGELVEYFEQLTRSENRPVVLAKK